MWARKTRTLQKCLTLAVQGLRIWMAHIRCWCWTSPSVSQSRPMLQLSYKNPFDAGWQSSQISMNTAHCGCEDAFMQNCWMSWVSDVLCWYSSWSWVPFICAGTSAEDLLDLFNKYGTVADVFIPRDKRWFIIAIIKVENYQYVDHVWEYVITYRHAECYFHCNNWIEVHNRPPTL